MSHRTQPTRSGATLTEVLMSLMIMSIGVVSLATLFPISAQRVLEATNLTNATVLKYNAEGIVDSFPDLVHEPDGDTVFGNFRTSENGRNYVVDPLGWLELESQIGTNHSSISFFEYNRPTSVTRPVLSDPATGRALPTRFLGENPTAGRRQLFTSLNAALQIATLPDTTTDWGEGFPDPDGTNVAAYTTNAEGRVIGLTLPVEIDMSTFTLASTDPAYTNPADFQIVVFDKAGERSELRRLSTVSAAGGGLYTVTWEQDLNGSGGIDVGEDLPLPLHFTTDANGIPNVGLIRVERKTALYSWMLSVRKSAGNSTANVDVVVFSNRDFSQLSEQLYIGDLRRHTFGDDGGPGEAGFDDNQNGVVDDVGEIGLSPTEVDTDGDGYVDYRTQADDQRNNRFIIDWNPANYSTAPLAPELRKGGYVYDSANGLWYRIQGIESGDIDRDGVPEDTSATLILESTISRNNSEDLSGDGGIGDIPGEDINNNGVLDRGGVIVMPGVVAVFPLETKSDQ